MLDKKCMYFSLVQIINICVCVDIILINKKKLKNEYKIIFQYKQIHIAHVKSQNK